MQPVRDNARSKILIAERGLCDLLLNRSELVDYARTILSLPDVEAVLGRNVVDFTFKKMCCCVLQHRPGAAGRVVVPYTFRRHAQVLHGVAHLMAPASEHWARHGALFCATYLYLVDRTFGLDHMDWLRDSFVDAGIDLEIDFTRVGIPERLFDVMMEEWLFEGYLEAMCEGQVPLG